MSRTLDEFIRKQVEVEARAVYLASAEGFSKYCEGCAYLAKVEELKGGLFTKRVFCKAEKCVK